MPTENFSRLPEEEERGINQITNPELARSSAEIEKPIRDLGRDPKTDRKIRKLKPLLDKEAERMAEAELPSKEMLIKQELLLQPIRIIKLSTTRRTNAFINACFRKNVSTIEELTKKMGFHDIERAANMTGESAQEVQEWLSAHNLDTLKPFVD